MNSLKNKNIPKYLIYTVLILALPFLIQMISGTTYLVMILCISLLYMIAVSGLDILFGYSGQIPGSEYLQLHYKRLEEALIDLAEYAQNKNVKLVVEDNPQYVSNFLNSADEVGYFVRSLNLENVGLHLDTHCMAMEDDNIEKSLEKFSDILIYLHYSDANRGYPGSCSIDFLAIAKTLMDIDYQGYITLECQPYPNSEECARRGLQYVKAIEQAAAIKRMPLKDTLYKK